MRFFVGLHQPSDAQHVAAAFISVTRLRRRKGLFVVHDWIMDSGAFSTIATHGGYPAPVEEYAAEIHRWKTNGNLLAAVAQDYMCEPWMVAKTGLSVREHQRLTIERYDALTRLVPDVYILPVLQGYNVEEYVAHVHMYGDRLAPYAWVGVGSVCKRNTSPQIIAEILEAIHAVRPDLALHGFGIKKTALYSPAVRMQLVSADSMAWSFAARRDGGNANDWREAAYFAAEVQSLCRDDEQVLRNIRTRAWQLGDPFADIRGYW